MRGTWRHRDKKGSEMAVDRQNHGSARAIENQVFVVETNRVGRDDGLIFGGHSQVVTPYGETTNATEDEITVLTTEIDPSQIESFRNLIPCLKERVPATYHV